VKLYRLLTESEAASIVDRVRELGWAQGRASSEYASTHVKRNRELSEAHGPEAKEIIDGLKAKFTSSPLWMENYVTTMTPPRFNRYGEGEEYGMHADAAWMGRVIRTDLACTLFLTADYEGGELEIDGNGIKCEPGVAVVYPCWRPHRVKPVTRGERIAVITWMQSLLRDETQREVMQRFSGVLSDIKRDEPEGRHYADLSAVYSKILRMWMEI
jgi:PKHD-type hydroxylase